MDPRLSRRRRGGPSHPCRLLERSGRTFAPRGAEMLISQTT
jgi:hypothetical protein